MIKFNLSTLKKEWLIIIILIIASSLRLYNFQNSLHFQGDQGRDALIVSKIFKQKDLVFIGPVTSVGNMYLGPLYYYFMLPFLWLSYPSPIGPAYAVAILGILTVWLIYKWGQQLVGKRAAIIGAIFYTFSHTVITFTRFSWNPNPAPLISLAMIYFTFLAWQKSSKYWILVMIMFAILLQLHYLTLLSAFGAGLIWLTAVCQNIQTKQHTQRFNQLKQIVFSSLIGFVILLISFTPLVLFDAKHNWLNVKAFYDLAITESNFKTSTNITFAQKIILSAKETHGRSMHILFEISLGQNRALNTLLLLSTTIFIAWLILDRKNIKDNLFPGRAVILCFLVTGILGTAFYQHNVFDHYIAYLFPVTFLIYGIILDKISTSLIGKTITIGFISYFLWYNLPRIPLRTSGWTINDMQKVTKSIDDRVNPGDKYNLVLLSESGDIDGQNYRYFLSTTNNPPVITEKRGEIDKLFIINEDHVLNKVTDSPIYEIVVFPNKTAREIYSIPNGPEISVLSKK